MWKRKRGARNGQSRGEGWGRIGQNEEEKCVLIGAPWRNHVRWGGGFSVKGFSIGEKGA